MDFAEFITHWKKSILDSESRLFKVLTRNNDSIGSLLESKGNLLELSGFALDSRKIQLNQDYFSLPNFLRVWNLYPRDFFPMKFSTVLWKNIVWTCGLCRIYRPSERKVFWIQSPDSWKFDQKKNTLDWIGISFESKGNTHELSGSALDSRKIRCNQEYVFLSKFLGVWTLHPRDFFPL